MSELGFVLASALKGGLTAEGCLECARTADELGHAFISLGDGHGYDAFAVLGACAIATKRVNLGTTVLSVFMRTPTQTALGAAAIDTLSEGRFILGLGSSHKVQVEAHHGVKYERPIQRVRETVEIIRTLLRDGVISYHGEIFNITNFDLSFQPFRKNLPIRIAAINPKMLEMAGEVADSVLLFMPSLSRVTESIGHLKKGLAKSGKNIDSFNVAANFYASVNKDSATAKKAVKRRIVYAVGYFPRYNNLLVESGFPIEAARIRGAFLDGDMSGAADAVTDAIIDTVAVAGNPEECKARIEDYRAAGVESPILLLNPLERENIIESMKLLS